MWKIATASFVGTAIEWYDFFLFGTASALVFNRVFFPDVDPTLGTLAALATFATGFFARPLGAAVFGHLGDTRGRKSVLILTLLITGLATAAVGVLPTYAQVGLLAPIMLVALRLAQGIGLGGEWGGAMLLGFEHAPGRRRGFYASWAQTGAPAGLLLANVVFLGVSSLAEPDLLTWGWRVPFLLSLTLVVVGLAVRIGVAESPEFTAMTPARAPLLETLRGHLISVLVGAGGRAAEAAFITIFSAFVLGYAVQSGVPRPVMLGGLSLATLVIILVVPVAAVLSDRLGRRAVYLAGSAFATLAALPACLLIDSRQPLLITLGLVLGMLGPAIMFGPQASFIAELFPARIRSSGSSLAFQVGGVIFGGLAPLAAAALVALSGNLVPVGVLMLALGLVSIVSVALAQVPARRETTGAISFNAAPGITA